jgi:hypothetical protein
MWKNTWAKIFSMLCDVVHLVRPQRVDELVLVVLEHCLHNAFSARNCNLRTKETGDKKQET